MLKKVPVIKKSNREHLEIGGKQDEWCLAYENCYYFCL